MCSKGFNALYEASCFVYKFLLSALKHTKHSWIIFKIIYFLQKLICWIAFSTFTLLFNSANYIWVKILHNHTYCSNCAIELTWNNEILIAVRTLYLFRIDSLPCPTFRNFYNHEAYAQTPTKNPLTINWINVFTSSSHNTYRSSGTAIRKPLNLHIYTTQVDIKAYPGIVKSPHFLDLLSSATLSSKSDELGPVQAPSRLLQLFASWMWKKGHCCQNSLVQYWLSVFTCTYWIRQIFSSWVDDQGKLWTLTWMQHNYELTWMQHTMKNFSSKITPLPVWHHMPEEHILNLVKLNVLMLWRLPRNKKKQLF